MAAGLAAAFVVSVGGRPTAGFGAVAWAVLAGTLVAYIVDVLHRPEDGGGPGIHLCPVRSAL